VTTLRDILHRIDLARKFVAGFGYEAFLADARRIYAVARYLEVISEAGNIYRHDYEDVAPRYIWDTVACPPILAACGSGSSNCLNIPANGTGDLAAFGGIVTKMRVGYRATGGGERCCAL
jgi:hypothetical protein